MTLSLRHYLFIVGSLLAVGGFIALLAPVSVPESAEFNIAATCGNGFAMDESEVRHYKTVPTLCEDAISTRQAWSWPLLIGGLVVAGAGFVVPVRRREEQQPTDAAS